jgi:hypothetical protein
MPKRTTSYDDIARATVPGVDWFRGVVKPPQEHTGPERELVQRVRTALDSDPRLDAHRIEVSAHGSRIRLTGVAPGPGSAAFAADVAGAVEGVSEVINELGIDPGGR